MNALVDKISKLLMPFAKFMNTNAKFMKNVATRSLNLT